MTRLVLLLLLLSSCRIVIEHPHQETPTPSPVPVLTPVPTPTPTPGPALGPLVRGHGRFRVRWPAGIWARGGDYAPFVSVWSGDPSLPAAELSIRGTDSAPCLVSPCEDGATGVVLRYSGNVYFDGTGIPESEMCGQGLAYRQRIPVGSLVDGWAVVSLDWDPDGVTVSTPVCSRRIPARVRGAVGWTTPVLGVPGEHGMGWGRAPWTVQHRGGTAEVMDWTGTAGDLNRCP